MSFTHEIFKRATVRGITEYLLYGVGPDDDRRDYETRLNESSKKYEKAVELYNKGTAEDCTEFLRLTNELKNETAGVYAEIGLQSGMLLVFDMLNNVLNDNKGADYKAMYSRLFKDVTSAIKFLQETDGNNAPEAANLLKLAQCETEKIFMDSVNTPEKNS